MSGERGGPESGVRRSHQTMTGYVAQAIRERVTSGQEIAGARLNQRKLADELGVSLIPLREALRLLEAQGLVKIYPHRGAFVAGLSPDEIREIFLIRAHLDPLATESAVNNREPEVLDRLGQMIEEMKRATQARDFDALTICNREFHASIYQGAAMPILCQVIMSLRDRYSTYSRVCIELRGYAERSLEDHLAIFEAYRAGEAAEAGRLMREHLRFAADVLVTHLATPVHGSSRGAL